MSQSALTVAAEVVLIAHAAFIVFVVGGQGLILAGWMLGWRWPRNPPFRLAHAGAIALVVLESWFGIMCPLTWLEFRLRAAAGSPLAADSFIGYWPATADLPRRAPLGVHPGLHVLRRGGGGHLRLLSPEEAGRAPRPPAAVAFFASRPPDLPLVRRTSRGVRVRATGHFPRARRTGGHRPPRAAASAHLPRARRTGRTTCCGGGISPAPAEPDEPRTAAPDRPFALVSHWIHALDSRPPLRRMSRWTRRRRSRLRIYAA